VKCFIVDCEQENGAQLYFAESHNQAKCHAANEAGIEYVEVTSCRRKPEYDQYSPGPVPTKVLIEDGWWFECYGCYRTVSSNEMYDDDADKELDGSFLAINQNERFCLYPPPAMSRDNQAPIRGADRAYLAAARCAHP